MSKNKNSRVRLVESSKNRSEALNKKSASVLRCKCGREVKTTVDVIKVICYRCVANMVEFPKIESEKEKSNKPQGWKFMSMFVDSDGTVYEKGVENPELKGKYEVTDVDKIKREQKKKKALKADKKEEKLVKVYKKKLEEKKKIKIKRKK